MSIHLLGVLGVDKLSASVTHNLSGPVSKYGAGFIMLVFGSHDEADSSASFWIHICGF